jgi:hypothetical protein
MRKGEEGKAVEGKKEGRWEEDVETIIEREALQKVAKV